MDVSAFNQFFGQAAAGGILFYYTGPFTSNVVSAMSDAVRERLDSIPASAAARRKVFSSFVEMAQNVLHYGGEQAGGKVGALAVAQSEDRFHIVCGNPIRIDHIERIRSKLEPLRSMTLEEIKAAYRAQLRNDTHEQDSISKGAGLGLLTVARDATEPIEYQIVLRSSDETYADFLLRACI